MLNEKDIKKLSIIILILLAVGLILFGLYAVIYYLFSMLFGFSFTWKGALGFMLLSIWVKMLCKSSVMNIFNKLKKEKDD